MYLAGTVKRFVKHTYFDGRPMEAKDYERGRKLFVPEGCTASAVFTLTSGAFLSGYIDYMGADESLNGIITGIPTMLCAVQLFSSVVLENIQKRKFLIAIMAFLHRILLSLMLFIPFFVEGTTIRLALLVLTFAAAHFCNAFVGTGASNWMIQLVPNKQLGYYLGTRDAFSLGFTTIVSLVMGRLLDWFRLEQEEGVGFLLIGTVVLAIAFVNFYCISSIKEPEYKKSSRTLKLTDVLTEPLKNRKFRKVMLFYVIWNIAVQIAGPFFSVYQVTGLKMDYTYIMMTGLLACIARVLTSSLWGKLADQKSWLYVAKLSIMLLGITHLIWMFMTKDSYFILQPVLQITSGIAWGGITISTLNVQYMFAPEEGRVMYVSANGAYAGIIGFISTLVGAALLTALKPVYFGGFELGTMQMLFAISGILIGFCVLYIHMVLEKQKEGV